MQSEVKKKAYVILCTILICKYKGKNFGEIWCNLVYEGIWRLEKVIPILVGV